ncbi:hypothetical protein J4443_04390 [Candidatus Woesearchaeota archaeon]|nr:hypothetical protein [Candidatus Woesearchaeota archaeon]
MKSLLNLALLLLLILMPAALSANVDLDKLDIVKISIAESEEKTLQFNKVEYKAMADSVTDDEAKLTFSPGNNVFAVKKEKPADVDLDDDNKIDFSVSYLSFSGNKASLEFKRLNFEAATGEEKQAQQIPDLSSISNALEQNLKFIAGAVAVLVIIVLIMAFSRRKGNPEKLYRKAEDLHREAQEFHEDGDEETAAELYERAEEFREKARSLEKGEI